MKRLNVKSILKAMITTIASLSSLSAFAGEIKIQPGMRIPLNLSTGPATIICEDQTLPRCGLEASSAWSYVTIGGKRINNHLKDEEEALTVIRQLKAEGLCN